MKKAVIPAFLLVLASTVLGATVLREPLAWAAAPIVSVLVTNDESSPIPAREQNLDANGNIKVHEQGTADVNVANTPLPVADGGGSLTVDGSVGISGTPNVNVANASVPVTQSGAWNVGIEGIPTVRPGVPSEPFWDSASLTTANSLRVVGGTTDFIGLTGITATNFDHSTVAQVEVQNGITTGPGCSGSAIGGSVPHYTILVPPRSTEHLDLPTPALFRAVSPSGAEPATDTCIRLQLNSVMSGSVAVAVNGFSG